MARKINYRKLTENAVLAVVIVGAGLLAVGFIGSIVSLLVVLYQTMVWLAILLTGSVLILAGLGVARFISDDN